MKTIVALVDFSDVTFKVLKHACTLARAFDSHVIILHVVADPTVVDFGSAIAEATLARRQQVEGSELAELAESVAKFGVKVTTQEVQGATLDRILEESARLNPDLIIMGTHGHGALYNLLIGSVTEEVVKRSHYPVLVVPAA